MRSKDVVVVDAHGRPSAAALIAQLNREVTDKPVRYVIYTHFHGDAEQITADSLKSLASNSYGAFLTAAMAAGLAHFGAPVPMQDWVH